MRRLLPVVPAMLLAVLLLVPATATAAPAAQPTVTVLAVEGGEEGPVGPDPRGPNDPENTHAPDEYQANFLINAAVGLTALLLLLVVGLGGLYWLLVKRPEEASKR